MRSAVLAHAVVRAAATPSGFDAHASVATAWLPRDAYDTARARALAQNLLAAMPPANPPLAALSSYPPFTRVTAQVRRPDEKAEPAWTAVGRALVAGTRTYTVGAAIAGGLGAFAARCGRNRIRAASRSSSTQAEAVAGRQTPFISFPRRSHLSSTA